MATANLRGTVLKGKLRNPLGVLEQQLLYTLNKMRDQCPSIMLTESP